ncbi:MAG: winged helix-turn-helix domain-containing protein [Alphaproteobacteria bacterium]
MTDQIIIFALPKILPQALAEQGRSDGKDAPGYDWRMIEPDKADQPIDDIGGIRLLLLGDKTPPPLKAWREAGLRAPALLLGQTRDGWDVAETLPLPVRIGLLLERISYYVQLSKEQNTATVACGPYAIDQGAKKLRHGGLEQPLTDKETVLLTLLARDGAAWTREDLLREVWGYDAGIDTHTLETHIYRLRRKLAELGDKVDIVTVMGGYALQWS